MDRSVRSMDDESRFTDARNALTSAPVFGKGGGLGAAFTGYSTPSDAISVLKGGGAFFGLDGVVLAFVVVGISTGVGGSSGGGGTYSSLEMRKCSFGGNGGSGGMYDSGALFLGGTLGSEDSAGTAGGALNNELFPVRDSSVGSEFGVACRSVVPLFRRGA